MLFTSKLCRAVKDNNMDLEKTDVNAKAPLKNKMSRRDVLQNGSFLMIGCFMGLDIQPAASAEGKVYSTNARNMQRLSTGDTSAGSVYDNNPTPPKARTRRAIVGCKNSSARSLAGETIGAKSLSEKDCNMTVMGGVGPDFMLDALTKLDCPTCPYGIGNR